ncbi:peptidoglycan recognition protein family protein [Pseudonocardia pini]|uniref:peptidoglycan recognition protein family protein n=1 Tax=Pseudonocardia pini TaxID=2758030 RepID=UPI001C689A5C|nr:peptidoglycan-binding domain-containing protein [Pseudonocardia pini]
MTRRGFVLGGVSAGALLAAPGVALAQPGAGAGRDAGRRAGVLEGGPDIVDCGGWGARPNSAVVPVWNQRPVKILVHHTASPNVADTSRGAADAVARSIQNFHMDARGWLDTGQHFTISRGGFVLEGRHRSLEVLRGGRQQVEGAHCTGQNVVAVGIENEGIYIDQDPPGALWDSLRATCAYICGQYGIAPTELYGHRDFKNTICPGDRLYGMLPRLRSEVAGVLGQRIEGGEVKASWPLLRQGDSGEQVLAAQYLLRDAGVAVKTDGRFTPATAAALTEFQVATGAEEPNGILGGESWPVLARTVERGEGSDAERAVDSLASGNTEAVPDTVDHSAWQRLLGTGGAEVDQTVDPVGPVR